MRNIRLILEFDGGKYAGWQLQPKDATVQSTLNAAIKKLTGEDVKTVGSSRTDSGVHAFAFVVNFLTKSDIKTEGFKMGLNTKLPEDIVVKKVDEVPLKFNSRSDAKSKTYLYRIFNDEVRPALERHRSWHVAYHLDEKIMAEGAKLLIGKKDFSSFRAARSSMETSVREIYSFTVSRSGSWLELRVSGKGFLRHMVRIMAGTLAGLCDGKITILELEEIIEARDRSSAPVTAPSEGLFLVDVEY